MTKGKYVLIEGGENCGKSTQIAKLQEWFPHSPLSKQFTGLTVTREPGGTALGQEIRQMLLHGQDIDPTAELLLFAADRAQHMAAIVRPALERGELVIQDRGFLSTLAYQGYGRGLDMTEVREVNEIAMWETKPDLAILLDVPPRLAIKRGDGNCDRIEQLGKHFHRSVYQGLLNEFHYLDIPKACIDGTQPVDKVFEDVIEALAEHLE